MKRSETWDDGPVQAGPEGEAPPTARELLEDMAEWNRHPDSSEVVLAARVEKVLALHKEGPPGWSHAIERVVRILNGESE